MERSLVLIKPDGVERGLIGEIIGRFERVGLKIIAIKMQWVDKDFAMKHYTEDITKRRGEHIRLQLLDYLTECPVVAIVLEGLDAIEIIRKMVGETEPKASLPGTIRGDFAHISYSQADKTNKAIRNLIHASGNKEDAKYEIPLWFAEEELHSYKTVHDKHILQE